MTFLLFGWSVCSEVYRKQLFFDQEIYFEACAARSERMQRGQSVHSEVCVYKSVVAPFFRYFFIFISGNGSLVLVVLFVQ